MSSWIESEFNTHDGLSLFYRYRKPDVDTKNTLIFLHRGHEHSARVVPFADQLSQQNSWCFAFDLRGHGLSEGERAWASSFDCWVKDLNSFVGHIRHTFGIKTSDAVLVANSVGSVMAVCWIMKYGANLKGCILGAPAFSIRLYVPFALPALRLARKFSNRLFVTSYVRSSLLTRDEKQARLYDIDPMITKKIGVNVLVSLFDSYRYCEKRLKDFEIPVLLFTASNDYIVDNKRHDFFYNEISSTDKQHIVLQGFRHAIFHETEQYKILNPSLDFIGKLFGQSEKRLPAVIPKAREHTVSEYRKLHGKGSQLSQLYYHFLKSLLLKLGKLSYGIAIGIEHGFDSGLSLDYVYKNTPSGGNSLGKMIDKVYLNSTGWRGIRSRKYNLKATLKPILAMLNEQQIEPVIFDVASGPARYLFEIREECEQSIYLHLNDIDSKSIAAAKNIAMEFNACNVSFSNINAFDGFDPCQLSRRPNIIIISGLLELYENNHLAYHVISNMYAMLEPNGYIIYTGQPWHPQMEMIARLLNNRNGERWIMRRRVQSEMDQLITSAGFEKLSTLTDELGIFTVSCAQKTINL